MIGILCDFCSGDAARWALPCDDLALRATGAYGTAVAALAGAWSACDACLTYIHNGDPDGLADHVTRAGLGPPALLRMTTASFRNDVFKALYRKVLPWLGPPRPLDEAVGAGGALHGEPGAQP